MDEIREFSYSDMEFCPDFTSNYTWEEVRYIGQGKDTLIYCIRGDDGSWCYGDSSNPFKCDPKDRMNAMCKRVFDMIPNCERIFLSGDVTFMDLDFQFVELAFNPFLYTNRTQVLREELDVK